MTSTLSPPTSRESVARSSVVATTFNVAADPATVTVAAAAAIVVTRNFVRERMIMNSFWNC